MVSARVVTDLSKFDTYSTRTETLSEWITTVRFKKGLIRRQRKRADLRVAAVLTTAILRAETELRRKQSERAQRWAEVRRIHCENGLGQGSPKQQSNANSDLERDAEETAKLWTNELVGLENLFNDLSQIKTVVAR